jgi:Family of unknown function (DUF5692)
MQLLVWIVATVLAALVFVEIVRRLPPAVGLVGFLLVAPLSLCFPFTGADEGSLFSFVKVASAAVGAAYIQALKITRWADHPLGRAVAFGLLAVNILEAVVAEAAQGGFVNAAAGLLLILTQASPGAVGVAPREAGRDFSYRLGGPWIAAYTLWNFTFVYGRVEVHGATGAFAAMAVVHLLGPLLASRRASELWLQARAFVLTPIVALRVVAPYPPYLCLSPGWYVPAVAGALRIGGLTLAGYVAVQAFARARRTGEAADAIGWVAQRLEGRGSPRGSGA